MAQLNITLNQGEMQALLLEDQGEAFKKILQTSLNKILQTESAEQLKAGPYERSEERTDSRNGSRDRDLNTRVGRITLQVPRHRNVPFKTLVFENYSRSEAALVAGMAEMVVNGVSTRKVSRVMETLCGTSFSKSAVSDVCKDLDKAVKELFIVFAHDPCIIMVCVNEVPIILVWCGNNITIFSIGRIIFTNANCRKQTSV